MAKEEILGILNDDAKFNQVAQAAFEQVDTDSSGLVSRSELKNSMAKVAAQAEIAPPQDEEVEAAMKQLDTNRDGSINLEEFKVHIR
jgi:Ca2+-binding EF-hand superfamily protein